MKITISPTEDQSPFEAKHPTVSIEIPGDDQDINEVITNLIVPALLAYGFSYKTVRDYFPD